MAFNIFSTLNQNLQNFGGDAYDAYQAGKSKVGNVASTINTNLQDFGGDIYDVGSTIKKNVSDFGTKSINQGKQAVNQIQSNVSQFGSDVSNKASSVKKSILAPADRFMTDVTKIGNARKATQYGISEKDKSALMNQMLDAGQYSDDEIIQAVAQLDAEEKARKQKEFSDWEKGIRENASTTGKILGGSVEFAGGVGAGMMRLPAGVTDFVTGGTDYTKDTMQGINDFTSRSGAAQVGDIAGQIAGTAIIPGVGRIAPSGTGLAATAGRGAVYGGAFGGLTPVMQKGSEATFDEIGESALAGAGLGAIGGVALEKGIPALIKGTQSGIQAGKFAEGNIAQKVGVGTQAFGKSVGRQTMQGVKEAVKAPVEGYRNAVQSMLSNRSDKTKNVLAQAYGMENQEIGAIRSVGKDKVTKMMDKMDAIDQKALAGGGVNSIYDDLHKEIMGGVQKRSNELSALERQKEALLKDAQVVIKKSELDDLFDDVIGQQGIKRTKDGYVIVGEGEITKNDLASINRLYDELVRTKGKTISAVDMNARIRNLQKNLYNKDGTPGFGSDAMSRTAEKVVAKSNELLKNKLPPEYAITKAKQSKIIQQRQAILKALKEDDNALALLPDEQIANMSEKEVVKLINDSIAGNKMALFLKRLANSTTTGGDAKQLANIIKSFTGLDVENQAIALRAIAKMTGNKQILNELGGLLDKGIVKGTLKLAQKIVAPSPDKVIKAVATKPPTVSKAKPKATKPPIVPKAKPKATTESAFKNNKGFINPSEIKKSLVPKKGADEARQFYDDLVYAGNSPIVAQRETAKRFGTIRAMSASKAGTLDISASSPNKKRQLAFIHKNNPMRDDIHTGIRKVEDIKTFKETLSDPESLVYPDFTIGMAERALKENKITIYSSKPLDTNLAQFVTPSKMQASDYAGNGKVYSKKVELSEVAWINSDEGQLVGKMESGTSKALIQKKQSATIDDMETKKLIEEAKKYKSAEEFDDAVNYSSNAVSSEKYNLGKASRLYMAKEYPSTHINLKDFQKMYGDEASRVGIKNIGNNGTVTIYRSATGDIQPGDWIAFDKKYAQGHSRTSNHKIYSKEVPVKDVLWAGTSGEEWFYAPSNYLKSLPDTKTIWEQANKTKVVPNKK